MEHGVFEAFASADPPWSFLREAGFIELHWEFVAQLGHVHFQLYQLYFWWVTSSSIAIKCMIFNDCQQRNFLMIGLVWFRISVIVLQMGPWQCGEVLATPPTQVMRPSGRLPPGVCSANVAEFSKRVTMWPVLRARAIADTGSRMTKTVSSLISSQSFPTHMEGEGDGNEHSC